MAAITTAIAAGVSLAGIGLSAKQLVDQNKLMNDAKGAAQAAGAKLDRMKLENAYADMQVPALGYELAQQGLDRQTMAALQTAQGAGAEGVLGGVGRINEAANEQELQMMAQLQQDELNRDKMVAEGQMYSDAINLKNARELEASRLAGAQEAMKQAQLNKQQAIQGMVGSGVSALGYLGSEDLIPLYGKRKEVVPYSGYTLQQPNNITIAPKTSAVLSEQGLSGLQPVVGGQSVLPNYLF